MSREESSETEPCRAIDEDVCAFILKIVDAYDGSSINTLRRGTPWLHEFDTRSPSGDKSQAFELSQEAFVNDGIAFVKVLEEFADLLYLEVYTALLTQDHRVLLVALVMEMARLQVEHSIDEEVNIHCEAIDAWREYEAGRRSDSGLSASAGETPRTRVEPQSNRYQETPLSVTSDIVGVASELTFF